MTDEVRIDVHGHVGVVTLNAASRGNAITPDMALELISTFDTVDADERIGALVVHGAGGTFCAGAHRDVVARAQSDPVSADNYEDIGNIYESFARLGRVKVPTIAAVTGAAVGAGLNLALSTDLRIVAADARFLSGFVRLGIHPGGGFFTIANKVMGAEATAAVGLFGEEISGEQAKRIGMAWDATDKADVLDRATALASRVADQRELARDAAATMRLEIGPPGIPWAAALQTERAPQLRSLKRRNGGTTAKH